MVQNLALAIALPTGRQVWCRGGIVLLLHVPNARVNSEVDSSQKCEGSAGFNLFCFLIHRLLSPYLSVCSILRSRFVQFVFEAVHLSCGNFC